MDITTNAESNTVLVAKAVFPKDEVEKGFLQVYQETVGRVKIPGFRPGKAPYSIFLTHVGIESVKEDYTDIAATQAVRKIFEGKDIKIIGRPEAHILSFPDEGPLELSIRINHLPEFELIEPSSIKIETPEIEVKDEDITKAIDNIRNRYATMAPVNRPAKEKDFLYFNWSVVTDGKSSDRKKEELVEVGREDFVKDFDKNLIGTSSGDVKIVKAMINQGEEPVEIEITIGEVKERSLPELTDEFAKTLGIESVEALKQAVKAELDVQAEDAKNEFIEASLAKELIEKTKLEVPQILIEAQTDDEVEKLARELARKNLTLDIYLQKREIDIEKLRAELSPKAENQAKLDIILDEYAQKNEIEATEDEITQELKQISKMMRDSKRQPPDSSNPRIRANIKNLIERKKTVQTLMGKVQLTTKK
jgi:trigger factor